MNLPVVQAAHHNGSAVASWRLILMVTLLTAVAWSARSAYIASEHSLSMDANYHLTRGYAQLTGNPYQLAVSRNDGPLGQMLMALPLVVLGCDPGLPIVMHHWAGGSVPGITEDSNLSIERQILFRGQRTSIFMGHALSPDTLHVIISIWKTLLMVPAIVLVFLYVINLAGKPAAWLCWAMLWADPALAAHTSTLAIDALGAAFILLTVLAMLHYLAKPTGQRACLLGVALAAALLTKHTAVALLPILPLMWICSGLFSQFNNKTPGQVFRQLRQHSSILLATTAVCAWIFTGFDVSRPIDAVADKLDIRPLHSFLVDVLMAHLPCGVYIGGLFNGFLHVADYIPAYLMGEIYKGGKWYYFFVVWFLKTPLPLALVMLIGLCAGVYQCLTGRSPAINSARPLILAALLYLLFFSLTSLNTGLRHFIPAIVLWSVCASIGISWLAHRWVLASSGGLVASAFFMTLSVGPNLMSYVVWPLEKPVQWFSESNLDWNQSFKQVHAWLTKHQNENPADSTPIYILTRSIDLPGLAWQLKPNEFPNLRILTRYSSPPTQGLLIISPVNECSVYEEALSWTFLLPHKPIHTIGNNFNVYRLEEIRP